MTKPNCTSPGRPAAVLYARVSTGEQVKHGTSLESQIEACRVKAAALGLTVYAEYEDAGISGGLLLMRGGIQQAISDVQAGRADTLICANLSRFSRDAEHQQTLKKAIEAASGRIVFCDMAFDQTPEGDLAYGLMGQFAQYERQVIRARTMRGKRKRAEEGQQPQRSRPPFGYHIVTNAQVAAGLYPPEMRGHYLVAEPTAVVVRRLFADYRSGAFSLSTLCLALNREGVATPANGRAWREATLRIILMNPVYKGQPVSGRHKCMTDESRLGQRHKQTGRLIVTPHTRQLASDEHRLTLSAPPLVTEDVWDAVQDRLARGRAEGSGNPRVVRMLSGHTVCPHCGGKAGLKQQKANGKRYRYFICSGHKDARYQSGVSPCRGDLYPVETVEQAVLQALRDAWTHPQAVAAALEAYTEPVAAEEPEKDAELAAVRAALEELKAEEQATAQAQIAGIRAGAAPDVYAAMFADIADIAARRRQLDAQRLQVDAQRLRREPAAPARTRGRRTGPDAKARRVALQAMEQAWRVLTSPEVEGHVKRDLLLTVIEKVVCRKDGAEVVFLPGALGDAGEAGSTLHTTCIVCDVRRGQGDFLVEATA